MTQLQTLAALGPDSDYRSRKTRSVVAAGGRPVAEMAIVPRLVANDWVHQMREGDDITLASLHDAMSKAADIFEFDAIDDLMLREHEEHLSHVTGLPLAVIIECDQLICTSLRDPSVAIRMAQPHGCDLAPLEGAGPRWCRRGEVFAVNAAGNSPGVHATWLEALALGYRVVVRPSGRDPLTPIRLISALRRAGVPPHYAVLAPCDYETGAAVIENSDLSLVYGGQDVVDRYRNRPDVITRGPGRSKLLAAGPYEDTRAVELAAGGAIYHAGTACTATTGVAVEGDSMCFADEIAAVLSETPALPSQDVQAQLPSMAMDMAESLVDEVSQRADSRSIRLQPRVVPIDATTAVLTPAVLSLDSVHDPRLGHELPFPCLWVAPYERGSLDALAPALALTVCGDDAVAEHALRLPGVSNVYVDRPTSWTHPSLPHEGYLSHFLMETKGFRR